jgi:hypothetical protein
MQRVEGGPDEQVQNEQRGELVESTNETIGRQPAQSEQCQAAREIPE